MFFFRSSVQAPLPQCRSPKVMWSSGAVSAPSSASIPRPSSASVTLANNFGRRMDHSGTAFNVKPVVFQLNWIPSQIRLSYILSSTMCRQLIIKLLYVPQKYKRYMFLKWCIISILLYIHIYIYNITDVTLTLKTLSHYLQEGAGGTNT